MQSFWLVKNNKKACILFLAGWGMDHTPFMSIPAGEHDVLLVADYCQINPSEILQQVEAYPTVHLVAWSMGVWVAGNSFAYSRDLFSSATAINGTLNPIDEKLGIPPQSFDDMIENFSMPVLEGFYREMFDQPEAADRFLGERPTRPLESIARELRTLRKEYAKMGPGKDMFNRKIVGTRDRIFTARAQLRSWGKENCMRTKQPHFPFYNLPSWDTIIKGGV